jgi:hypothetical protein
MATITFPSSPKPSGMQWRLVMPSQNNVSGWTGQRQVIASNRGWWECIFTLPPVVGRAAINPWRSFIAQARGMANDFRVPVHPNPQSTLSNTVLVQGGGQTGRSIVTDGWPNSTTVLFAGDYVTIGDQLLQLTANVTSNGSGVATLAFEPPIRKAPADNAPVEYKNPYALMYFTEEPTLSAEIGDVYTLSFQFRESF